MTRLRELIVHAAEPSSPVYVDPASWWALLFFAASSGVALGIDSLRRWINIRLTRLERERVEERQRRRHDREEG